MNSEKVMKGFAFTHDAHLAALYAKRRELGRNDLTEEEWNAVVDNTNARFKAGEDALDILEEYTRQAEAARRAHDVQAAWPGAVGICCQCFEPVSSQELHQARPGGRKFHRRCFDRGGYYVRIEEKAEARRADNVQDKTDA